MWLASWAGWNTQNWYWGHLKFEKFCARPSNSGGEQECLSWWQCLTAFNGGWAFDGGWCLTMMVAGCDSGHGRLMAAMEDSDGGHGGQWRQSYDGDGDVRWWVISRKLWGSSGRPDGWRWQRWTWQTRTQLRWQWQWWQRQQQRQATMAATTAAAAPTMTRRQHQRARPWKGRRCIDVAAKGGNNSWDYWSLT